MFRYRYKASFSSRPTPSCRFFSTCLLELVPRPRAWEVRTDDRFAVAGGTAICLLFIVSCRSLACARSLLSRLRFGFSSLALLAPPACHRVSSRRVSSFLRLVRRPACFAHLGMRCRPVGRGGLPLRYASRPACSCRRVGAIVAGSSWPPACLPVRSFVAIVCCLLLSVYIVP